MEPEFENFVDLKSTLSCSASTPLLLFFKLNSEATTDSQAVVWNNTDRSHTSSLRPPRGNNSPNDSVKSQEADPDAVTDLPQAFQRYTNSCKCVSVGFITCRFVWPPLPSSREQTVHHKRPLWDPSRSTVTPVSLPSEFSTTRLCPSSLQICHFKNARWTESHRVPRSEAGFFSIMLLWPI